MKENIKKRLGRIQREVLSSKLFQQILLEKLYDLGKKIQSIEDKKNKLQCEKSVFCQIPHLANATEKELEKFSGWKDQDLREYFYAQEKFFLERDLDFLEINSMEIHYQREKNRILWLLDQVRQKK